MTRIDPDDFERALAACPVVAILRGLTPAEATEVADALLAAGIRILEVPLNSPDPFESIARLRAHCAERAIVGAGTVLTADQARAVAAAGGQICVAPNTDASVIKAAIDLGMIPIPGVATATEALAAIAAHACYLKLFPAGLWGPAGVKALRAVLPHDVRMLAVGGVSVNNAKEFIAAGCAGIGAGSELFVAGRSPGAVRERAQELVATMKRVRDPGPRIELCADTANSIGESPQWDPTTDSVAWIDISRGTLHSFRIDDGRARSITLETPLTALMRGESGAWLGTTADAAVTVDLESGRLRTFARIEHRFADCRLNDAAVDRHGRIWAGSMSRALKAGHGVLYRIDTAGSVAPAADGFGVCNGLGWSPDGGTFYLIDTLYRTLLAYDFDEDAGALSNARIVSDFLHVPGKPDGLAVAADGGIWVAMWGGACVVRLDGDGCVTHRLEMPVRNVSNCCFAGTDAARLFVTSARMRLSEEEIAVTPWSGGLLRVDGITRARPA